MVNPLFSGAAMQLPANQFAPTGALAPAANSSLLNFGDPSQARRPGGENGNACCGQENPDAHRLMSQMWLMMMAFMKAVMDFLSRLMGGNGEPGQSNPNSMLPQNFGGTGFPGMPGAETSSTRVARPDRALRRAGLLSATRRPANHPPR